MQILNRHHFDRAHRLPSGAVYVGRRTPLGNPYQIGRDGDREQVITRYAAWLNERLDEGDPVVLTALLGLEPDTALVCSCAPARCHAEVIQAVWGSRIVPILGQLEHRAAGGLYTGIGSRKTPDASLRTIRAAAQRLAERGFILRSGGAGGADTAFESGANARAQIFLPWPGFNRHGTSVYEQSSSEAFRIAALLHPAWRALSDAAQCLMARNVHQILGPDLKSPSDFVVCWTPDGVESEAERSRATGGTGQAIALAARWRVPVFNLHRPDALDRLAAWLADHPLRRTASDSVPRNPESRESKSLGYPSEGMYADLT